MLILSRKIGERIIIADNIVVSVLEIQGKKARIGIDAPADVHVRRQELPPRDLEAGSDASAEAEARKGMDVI